MRAEGSEGQGWLGARQGHQQRGCVVCMDGDAGADASPGVWLDIGAGGWLGTRAGVWCGPQLGGLWGCGPMASVMGCGGVSAPDASSALSPAVGPLTVGFSQVPTLKQIVEKNPAVREGGRYRPVTCEPRSRTAVIIPHRNRETHLRHLLYYLHPFLQRQQLQYGIYVIHQVGLHSPAARQGALYWGSPLAQGGVGASRHLTGLLSELLALPCCRLGTPPSTGPSC